MIIVKLQGGLGNQMFQYALGLSLAQRHRDSLAFDTTFLLDRTPRKNFTFRNYDLDVFNIHPRFTSLSEIANRLPIPILYPNLSRAVSEIKSMVSIQKYVREVNPGFNSEILLLKGNLYLDGYWQSEKYFDNIEDIIRREFNLGEIIDPKIKKMAEKIHSTESVCINVRRGDYVSLPHSAEMHGFVGTGYYRNGIEFIASKLRNPHFFITSDEIEWCVDNLRIEYPHTFIGHEYGGRKFRDYLRLMSLCRHFIIPNSSFAWWAAWLSTNQGKIVIAPRRWFNDEKIIYRDLVPESWIRI